MLTDVSLNPVSSQFKDYGFCKPAALRDCALGLLEKEYERLRKQAEEILRFVNCSNSSMAEYYRLHSDKLIAVAESDCQEALCRFEHIASNSDWINHELIPELTNLIKKVTGFEVSLFKDKCNLKSPKSGAFPPHQDIPAYLDFGPAYHITAAVFLDEANDVNGALHMATNYLTVDDKYILPVITPVGTLPTFECYRGGTRHGEIIEQVCKRFVWQSLYTNPGDIVLFNSYVPHYSDTNLSNKKRRALFFTFNLSKEGEHYEKYYRAKLRDYLNPKFHIATPTNHNGEISG